MDRSRLLCFCQLDRPKFRFELSQAKKEEEDATSTTDNHHLDRFLNDLLSPCTASFYYLSVCLTSPVVTCQAIESVLVIDMHIGSENNGTCSECDDHHGPNSKESHRMHFGVRFGLTGSRPKKSYFFLSLFFPRPLELFNNNSNNKNKHHQESQSLLSCVSKLAN